MTFMYSLENYCFVCISSALMYLNGDFTGGDFFFADGNLAIEVRLT